MDYKKIFTYINFLNSNNLKLKDYYKEIINFENVHFIPAVTLETALFLKWISNLLQPKNILEIGFGNGVSSIFIFKGLDKIFNFFSLERDNNRYQRGLKLLKKYKINSIQLMKKDAFNFLKYTTQHFDLIFLDAVKSEYHKYIPLIKPILNLNGILICDNILFGGKVVSDKIDKKYENGVKYMKLFNKMISEDKDFNTFFLTIGDGVSISIKT